MHSPSISTTPIARRNLTRAQKAIIRVQLLIEQEQNQEDLLLLSKEDKALCTYHNRLVSEV